MILTDRQELALRFVQAANAGGHKPHSDQVLEWLERPDPMPAVTRRRSEGSGGAAAAARLALGRPLGSTHKLWEKIYGDAFAEMLSSLPGPDTTSLFTSWAASLGEVEVAKPAEAFLDSLVRLGWLEKTELGGLSVTALGRALLRAQSHVDSTEDVLMLPADSEVSYARLIGHLADMSAPEGLFVVDPWLRLEGLMDLVNQAGAKRFLIGASLKDGQVATMLIWLEGMKSDVELRMDESRSLHDRYMIGDDKVYTLGTSMNSVGKRATTMLMPLPGEPGDYARDEMEKVWESATVRYPLPADSPSTPEGED